MKLRLNVSGYKHQPPETPMWTEITEHGGSVGRAETNDWVLPDPERFISSQHAAIHFVDGLFQVEDVSTNGVFINQAAQPIGCGNSAPLAQGDVITIGDYEITVDVLADGDAVSPEVPDIAHGRDAGLSDFPESPFDWGHGSPPEQDTYGNSPSPLGGPSADEPEFGVIPKFPEELEQPFDGFESEPDNVAGHVGFMQEPRAIPEQIPDDFLSDLTPHPPAVSTAPRPQPPPAPGPAAPAADAPASASPPDPFRVESDTLSGESTPPIPIGMASEAVLPPRPQSPQPPHFPPPAIQHREAMHGPAAGPPPGAGPSAPGAGHDDALGHIAAGAGMPGLQIPPDQQDSFYRLTGCLLREMVSGLIEVLHSRAEIKSQFRIQATTIRPRENNPLKLAVRVDDALQHLLVPTNDGYLAPMDAVEEAMADIKAHQLAVMAGMQFAMSSLLKQFEPGSLQKYFDAQGGKGMLESKKAWYWEEYTKLYSTIICDAEDNFQELFGEEFAKAYQTQIAKMRQMAKSRGS